MKVALCASFLLQALTILRCTIAAADTGNAIESDAAGTKGFQAAPTHDEAAAGPTASHKHTAGISRSLSDEDYATVACVGNVQKCGAETETVLKTARYGVSCCADYAFLGHAIKRNQCSVYAASRIFYNSRKRRWICKQSATYEDAREQCADLGARLCTEEELLNKCVLGTGCGYKKKMVWSGPEPETSSPTVSSQPSPAAGCLPNEELLKLELKTDNHPGETAWTLKYSWTENNATIDEVFVGDYADENSIYEHSFCIPSDTDCLSFTIKDSYGDGICCDSGNGYYKLWKDGNVLAGGGDFAYRERRWITMDFGSPKSCDP